MLQLANSVTMFPTNQKVKGIKDKYNTVDRSYFQAWLENNIPKSTRKDTVLVTDERLLWEIEKGDELWLWIAGSRMGALIMSEHRLDSVAQVMYAQYEPFKGPHEDTIANVDRMIEGDFVRIWIKETKPEEYLWLVPEHIVASAEAAKNDFDEIIVLEPKIDNSRNLWTITRNYLEEKIMRRREGNFELPEGSVKVLDDPILVGKIKWHDNTYFIIDYWFVDTPLISLWKNFQKAIEWGMSGMLIWTEAMLV